MDQGETSQPGVTTRSKNGAVQPGPRVHHLNDSQNSKPVSLERIRGLRHHPLLLTQIQQLKNIMMIPKLGAQESPRRAVLGKKTLISYNAMAFPNTQEYRNTTIYMQPSLEREESPDNQEDQRRDDDTSGDDDDDDDGLGDGRENNQNLQP
ncbi:hypothetical protein LIER_24215 [Lithospermum erythrorhizon]|uniref:Uncharacterized protein n=1 Tax=Lithospermum erythrorhizon TaxID=34254 RepID=A0AAV3R0E2_LITER